MSPPGVIVVVPPWPIGGSANIFAAAVKNHAALGRRVFLLVAMDNKTRGKKRAMRVWHIVDTLTVDGAEIVTHTVARRRRRQRGPLALLRWLRSGRPDTLAMRSRFIANAELPTALDEFIERGNVSIIHVSHCFNMLLGEKLRDKVLSLTGSKPLLVCDTHDIQANNKDVRDVANPATLIKSPAHEIERTELDLLSRADLLLHISKSDLDHLKNKLPQVRHAYLPPTISPNTESILVSLRKETPRDGKLVFVGANNSGNKSAVTWLIDSVLPLVPEAWQRLSIFGGISNAIRRRRPILAWRNPEVFRGFTKSPEDVYRNASAVLASARHGTGISIKVIEGLCTGRPVLGTSHAFRGLPQEVAEEVGCYDDPEAFAEALRSVLSGQQRKTHEALYDRYFSSQAYHSAFAAALGGDVVASEGHPDSGLPPPANRRARQEPSNAAKPETDSRSKAYRSKG